MEPGEKSIRRVLKFVLMIFALIVSLVFGEYSFQKGLGWLGPVIFIIAASMGGFGRYLLRTFKN